MFYIPISQEVLEYRQTRTISPDERAIQPIAAQNGLMLWSLTPLLAPRANLSTYTIQKVIGPPRRLPSRPAP